MLFTNFIYVNIICGLSPVTKKRLFLPLPYLRVSLEVPYLHIHCENKAYEEDTLFLF